MKLLAVRGVSGENPENTMPAFQAAADQGYDAIEVTIRVTRDLQCVILHDGTVNRTARRADGSVIEAALPVAELTLDQLLELDAGVGYHIKFKGTRIPLAKDVLALARETGLKVKVDGLWQKLRPAHQDAVRSLLEQYADVIDACEGYILTNGAIKPVQNQGMITDMHVHTDHSHDAFIPMEKMLQGGIAHGVKVMAIADHCDVTRCENTPDYDIYTHIRESCAEVDALNETYGDQCLLLRSVELGDGVWYPKQSHRVAEQLDYDVIVGATHAVRCQAAENLSVKEKWFSQINFQTLPEEQYEELMDNYFDDMLSMVRTQNIDIMAHILCGICYYWFRFHVLKDVRPYEKQIRKILETIIEKGIAMEMHGMLFLEHEGRHPYLWIVELYRELGGYLLTLSTDAHHDSEVGVGYEKRIELLKKIGFTHCVYYKNRKLVPVSL